MTELYKIALAACIIFITLLFGINKYVTFQNDKLDAKVEDQNKELIQVPLKINKAEFESKWKTIKEQPIQEVKHEELNTSVGKHRIVIRP